MINRVDLAALVAVRLLLTLVATSAALGQPVGESLRRIAEGAFGTEAGAARTLVKTTPMLLFSLGMVMAWRAGMYNTGGKRQFVVGALGGAGIAQGFEGLPGAILSPLILLAYALS